MAPVSSNPGETARKGVSLAMQRLQEAGRAGAVAAAMGTSESTISRIKTERLEEVVTFLAHLGVKCVPVDFKCVNPEAYAFLTRTHERVMREAPQLIWDVEQ